MNMIEFANKAAKNPGVKWLLKPLYYRYKARQRQKVANVFNQYGLEVIKDFDEAMKSGGYPYFLIFGSLLGAVREKGLIKHDFDLDTAMWYSDCDENFLPHMEKAGFRLARSFEVDGGKSGREWNLEKNGVSVDIFFFYPPVNSVPYCCDFPIDAEEKGVVTWEQGMKKLGGVTPRRVEWPVSKEYVRVPFENLMLPIPKNADELLRLHYGDTYMTPIAGWQRDMVNDPPTHLHIWEGKKAIFTRYRKSEK